MVRSGQVSNSNSNSKVGPELYTKIGFHPPTHHHHTISKSVSRGKIYIRLSFLFKITIMLKFLVKVIKSNVNCK